MVGAIATMQSEVSGAPINRASCLEKAIIIIENENPIIKNKIIAISNIFLVSKSRPLERLLAIIIEINPKGKVIGYDINEGYIKSCHRMTYNKVNKILDGDNELINEYNDIYDMLIQMNNVVSGLQRNSFI
jgi:hypothetical protein